MAIEKTSTDSEQSEVASRRQGKITTWAVGSVFFTVGTTALLGVPGLSLGVGVSLFVIVLALSHKE